MAFVTTLLFAALLQTATSRHLNDTIYLVTASSRMVGGAMATVCAQIQNPVETLALTVTLETGTANAAVLTRAVSVDFYECVQFQAPAVSHDTVASLHVSVRGKTDTMEKKSKVLISAASFISLIQTDKPIYKPGQTVRFRIVSMYSNFLPRNLKYKTVELQDPNSNRIAQWLDQTPVSGILDLSHPMSPEAAQGSYIITAWDVDNKPMSHAFDIKEYVLPKYEVKVHLPRVITILDREARLRVCGQYTYGKPVLGSVKATVCRKVQNWYWYWDRSVFSDICKTYELTTEKNGCGTAIVDLVHFALNHTSYLDRFDVEAEMEEYGTGVTLRGSRAAGFTDEMRTVTFEDCPSAYKPGIPYEGKVRVTGPDSSPAANELVYVTVLGFNAMQERLNLTTDLRGAASFSLDTSQWDRTMSLQARSRPSEEDFAPYIRFLRRPSHRSAFLSLPRFHSRSRSFVKVKPTEEPLSCGSAGRLTAQYIVRGEELGQGQDSLDFFYMVMSKGSVVQHGRIKVAVNNETENKGLLAFSLKHMADLVPVAQVVVYAVMPNGEAVADSMDFPIQLCLKNKVSLSFSPDQALPGANTTVKLQAHPGSLCSLRAIDLSVLLRKKEAELSVDSLFSQLPVQKMDSYSYQVEDYEPYPCLPPLAEQAADSPFREEEEEEAAAAASGPARRKRSYYFGAVNEKNDVYSVFKDVGVKILTNSDVKKPYDCNIHIAMAYESEGAMAKPMENSMKEKVEETVRTYFPETWIWDLLPIGETGTASLERDVPDSITTWAADAFCTSPDVGLGLAPRVELTAFQPFFVDLTLPYSVVRGEVFTLKATVFNYLSSCIMVEVTLPESEVFTSRECNGCQYTLCLCGEESRTFSWIITPTALGKISFKVSAEALKTEDLCGNEVATVPEKGSGDSVIRTLLVEAEGTPVSVSHNALLCPSEGSVEKDISLQLPEMFVAGSAKASVSILGDIMGRAMKNLDGLLAMPYGCGEQNMLLFAPNIYILKYLQSTSQLTQEIKDKAKHFMESGYQRELTYKHDDGSYSAFGKNDPSGNTWLTAFVMKSFGGARPFIFVDPHQIDKPKSWLFRQQREDGCFNSVGKLFHNGMKGGVSDDVSLTAYITAALLELDANAVNDTAVRMSLSCLKAVLSGQLNNTYTTALFFYTFTLAGDQETRTKLMAYLDTKASSQGGLRHWPRAGFSSGRLDSLEVEVTSYVLLALLSGPTLEGFGLEYCTPIVRWLIQQQNSYGGFASTQDTVVALQALAKYGAATYSPEGTTTLSVRSAGGLNKQYTVDQSNRLLYQQDPLSDVPGEYKVKAVGQSCVFVQISMRYCIPPPPDYAAFNISIVALANCSLFKPHITMSMSVRYNGRREETNMIIVNVKLLSGFILDKSSLQNLKLDRTVKRVDQDEGYVNIYLDGLKRNEVQRYSLKTEQDVKVRNLKPAVVKIYDYYQTSDEAVTEYTSPCAESDSINEL